MDHLTQLLLRPGSIALVVMTVALTFIVRRTVEAAWPALRKREKRTKLDVGSAETRVVGYSTTAARWWNEVVLYVLPLLCGFLWSLLESEFLFTKTLDYAGKLFFAMSLAWMSGLLYKAFKKTVPRIFGVTMEVTTDGDSLPPVP